MNGIRRAINRLSLGRRMKNNTRENGQKPNIAYLISMKHGLDTWTFRELEALENDINVYLFPLRYASGPYMPKAGWYCHRFSRRGIILSQLRGLKNHPAACFRLLAEAIRTRSIVDLLLAFHFSRQMAEHQVDIIHCVYGDHKFFIGYYCKRILHIPLTVALYGYDLRANPNWTLFRQAIHSADQVIVNCDYNKRLLIDAVGNGIQPSVKVIRHYAEIPVVPSPPLETVKILMVGGFSERKGHEVLFRAIRSLGADAANLEVWVVGYPDSVDVEQLARDFQVTDKVVVFGTVSDQGLNYFYQHCDIFCLPSKTDRRGISEGLPVSLIEAMAYGKPVISTRLAGIPELVEQILVEEGDVEGLARAIRCLVDDPALRHSLGDRNKVIVSDRYSKQNALMMRDMFFETVG